MKDTRLLARALPLLCATLLAPPILAQDNEAHISGVVLLPNGKPAAHASIAHMWSNVSGPGNASGTSSFGPINGIKADRAGRFDGTFRYYQFPTSVTVFDAARKNATIVTINEEDTKKPLVIKLKPATQATFNLTSENDAFPTMIAHFKSLEAPRAFGYVVGKGHFSLPVPAGKYEFIVHHRNSIRIHRKVTARPNKPLNLGTVKLKVSLLLKHAGKEPPKWSVSDTRGVPQNTQLSDYKGKWVILEFWGFW